MKGLAESFLKEGGSILYLDFDTAFTAFLRRKAPELLYSKNLIMFTPSEEESNNLILALCSKASCIPDLIVLDSITTLYHLLNSNVGFSVVNRMISIYLTLLHSLASRSRSIVVATSLVRAKRYGSPSGEWSLAPTGGRMLYEKSSQIILLDYDRPAFKLTLLKHPRKNLEGTVLSVAIKSQF